MKGSSKFIIGMTVIVLVGSPLLGQLAGKPAATVSVPRSTTGSPASESSPTYSPQQPSAPPVPPLVQAIPGNSSSVIEDAYRNHANSLPVTETGTVSQILSDDNEGSRHQRFIVRLASGHTVLIAHNIDIASRIGNLHEGDQVIFSGLYEWNAQGGVVHWTHHDPSRRHAGGYLQHNGMSYK